MVNYHAIDPAECLSGLFDDKWRNLEQSKHESVGFARGLFSVAGTYTEVPQVHGHVLHRGRMFALELL